MTALYLQLAASLVTATGVVLAGISLRGSQLQRNRQFEALYIERYWSLIDELAAEVAIGLRNDLRPEDEHVIRRYIQLCEDEVEMYARGWITERTFREWLPGMRAQLREGPYATVWKEVAREAEANASARQYTYLREVMSTEDEPRREVGPIRLRLRGV